MPDNPLEQESAASQPDVSSERSAHTPRQEGERRRRSPHPERTRSPHKNPSCMRPVDEELTPKPENVGSRFSSRSNNHRVNREPPKHPDGRLIRQPFNGQAHLYEVMQVRIVRTQRLVEINTNGLRLTANTPVLIRVHRNILLATTVGYRYRRVAEINSLPFVIRIASGEDILIDTQNAEIERHAQELASNYAIQNNLQMKVLSADLSHDHKNITINFASDVRVDFREMVAYLAGELKLRVEMYQLGLRNGTGLICGLGACGQLLCCGRFLGQFDPIAVKQLRVQGLATNPKRISGVCGRLYCCMSYEYCDYMKERRALPKKGKRIFTRWGIGRVTDIDMLREEVIVTYENGETQRLTPHDFVPASEEIQARIEADEFDFPLEPLKFYLNHDPSNAAPTAMQTTTRTTVHHSESSHKKSIPRKELVAAKPATSTEATPAKENAAAKEVTVKPRHRTNRRRTSQAGEHAHIREAAMTVPATDPAPTKERRIRSKHNASALSKQQAHSTDAPQAHTAPQTETVATAASQPPQETPVAHEPSHVMRMPRKVKARQANLEEANNQNAEARFDPARSNRRRFSPLNNNEGS